MKNKQGISLIVLVITIIVMIILAAAVVVSLSSSGVINKADEAVEITNEQQVEQIVALAWSEAYIDGKRTEEELKAAVDEVLKENNVDTNKYTVNVTTTGVEVIKGTFEISEMRVRPENGLIVECVAKVPTAYENPYVEFTYKGAEYKRTEFKQEGESYIYTIEMTPQIMGDTIDAKLYATYNGEEVVVENTGFSIEKYGKSVISKTASELNISAEKFEALKTLMIDTLEYGAMSQIFRGYNTSALVNDGLTGQTEYVELTSTDKETTDPIEGATTSISSRGISYGANIELYIKFAATDVSIVSIKVKVNDTDNVYDSDDFKSLGSGKYQLYTIPVLPTGYDDIYTFEVYENDTLVQTAKYSVKSYVYSQQSKTNSDGTLSAQANIVRALYNYGVSAKAYLAAK